MGIIEWRRLSIDRFETILTNVPLDSLRKMEQAALDECLFWENRVECAHCSLLKVENDCAA